MPYNEKFNLWHHETRFFSVAGKNYELTGTTTHGPTCYDTFKDEAGITYTVERNYFVNKPIVYLSKLPE